MYSIHPHGPHWLLRLPGGVESLFVARADAEAEGERLSALGAHPPVAWLRVGTLAPGEYAIPAGGQPTTCASCGAAIAWARTPAGAAVPLSLATARSVGGRRVARSHFMDCVDAKEWGS